MKGFFVTGTDTSVGKTLTASAITLALKGTYWKPVESGDSDYAQVKEWVGLPSEHFVPPMYALKASLSPDQAAQQENIRIDTRTFKMPQTSNTLIVEGAGGIFTPLNETECMIDVIKKFGLPVIVVSRGTLGTINHSLMTIEILRQRNIEIKGIVFSGELNPDNQVAIQQKGKVKILFHLPQFNSVTQNTLHAWNELHQQAVIEALT
ncbi:MAG: dethiobiotin synthase [Gammaproteobacteria bacterium]|nr:dethiobiotin synthase [Gammaproteobacteria bacterium]